MDNLTNPVTRCVHLATARKLVAVKVEVTVVSSTCGMVSNVRRRLEPWFWHSRITYRILVKFSKGKIVIRQHISVCEVKVPVYISAPFIFRLLLPQPSCFVWKLFSYLYIFNDYNYENCCYTYNDCMRVSREVCHTVTRCSWVLLLKEN